MRTPFRPHPVSAPDGLGPPGSDTRDRGASHGRGRLPAPRTTVTLLPRAGESMPAWVLERRTQELLLALIIDAPVLTPELLDGMVLAYAVRGGRIQLAGEFAPADPVQPELLAMREPRLIGVVQQRRWVRVEIATSVLVRRTGQTAAVGCYTVDLSAGGCLLTGAEAFAVGDELSFEILLDPMDRPVSGAGRVVRVDSLARRGIVFDSIEPAEWERLIDFLADKLPEGIETVPQPARRGP